MLTTRRSSVKSESRIANLAVRTHSLTVKVVYCQLLLQAAKGHPISNVTATATTRLAVIACPPKFVRHGLFLMPHFRADSTIHLRALGTAPLCRLAGLPAPE